MLRIALAKGRLQDDFLDLIYKGNTKKMNNRSLMIKDVARNWEIILPKAQDIAQYLDMGMADIAVVGNDVLLEGKSKFTELMDLNLGKCKMVIAGPKDNIFKSSYKRVATKYPNIARKIFEDKGIDIEIIYLQGSVELAVSTNIADVIVDIVQTGSTLRENGLIVYEELFDINAKLVVSKKISPRKYMTIKNLIKELEEIEIGSDCYEYI